MTRSIVLAMVLAFTATAIPQESPAFVRKLIRGAKKLGKKIKRAFRRAGSKIKKAFKKAGKAIKKAGQKIKKAFKKAGKKIVQWGKKVKEQLISAGKKAKAWMQRQWNKVKSIFRNRMPQFPQSTVKLRFPLEKSKYFSKVSIWHSDTLLGALGTHVFCRDYRGRWGIAFCYGAHRGTDYKLSGGFKTMDKGVAWIVAAAPGKVVEKRDGHYDRCQILDFKNFFKTGTLGVVCEGKNRSKYASQYPANSVTIEHTPDMRTSYAHFKKNTIKVNLNQQVTRGQKLGLVGSSGLSSFPHLHFQVERRKKNKDGSWGAWTAVDPYKGKYTQNYSYWCKQNGAYQFPSSSCK